MMVSIEIFKECFLSWLNIFYQSPQLLYFYIVDCKPGLWGSWSECSVTCGLSIKERSRTVVEEPKGEGAKCTGELKLKETTDCPDKGACPGKMTIELKRESRILKHLYA